MVHSKAFQFSHCRHIMSLSAGQSLRPAQQALKDRKTSFQRVIGQRGVAWCSLILENLWFVGLLSNEASARFSKHVICLCLHPGEVKCTVAWFELARSRCWAPPYYHVHQIVRGLVFFIPKHLFGIPHAPIECLCVYKLAAIQPYSQGYIFLPLPNNSIKLKICLQVT